MIRTGSDTYFTIWSVTEKDGKYTGKGSTARKDNRDGSYINSNWNIKFVKDAAQKVATIKERDKIVVKPGDMNVESVFLPASGDRKGTQYTSVTIFNFELAADKPKTVEQANSDELPF